MRVFINYKRNVQPDQDLAAQLEDQLGQHGHVVFRDETELRVGDPWPQVVMKNLDACDAFVSLVSNASMQSPWVINEIDRAIEKRKRLIPVWLEQLDSNLMFTRYRPRFLDVQHIVFEGDVKALVTQIAFLMAQEPSPGASVPPGAAAEPDLIANSIDMKLKLIQPGTFTMGCESHEACDDEKPAHQVTLTRPFYLGVYPVTQAEYERVTGSTPSHFKGPKRPVETISWKHAQELCRKLSERERAEYRLPTEAEWEYACRAGSTTEYCFGDEERRLGDYAWFRNNSGRETHDVGQKAPNAWGLHDMHGNVWEWCQDWKASYPADAQTDPTGPASGAARVLRGGTWYTLARRCRSAYRDSAAPDQRNRDVGCRVVRARRHLP